MKRIERTRKQSTYPFLEHVIVSHDKENVAGHVGECAVHVADLVASLQVDTLEVFFHRNRCISQVEPVLLTLHLEVVARIKLKHSLARKEQTTRVIRIDDYSLNFRLLLLNQLAYCLLRRIVHYKPSKTSKSK